MRTYTFDWGHRGNRDWSQDVENIAKTLKTCFDDVTQSAKTAAVR